MKDLCNIIIGHFAISTGSFLLCVKFKSCDFGGCLQNVISYVQKIQALEMFSLCYWRYYYNESTSVCLHLIRTRAGLNS